MEHGLYAATALSDSLIDSRTFRVLNIIDDHNRESFCIEENISFPAKRVIQALEIAVKEKGYPRFIRTDNGPEFISKEYKEWCKMNKIIPGYSEPRKPMQNGFEERFNRTLREDFLDAYLFTSLAQFNFLVEKWQEGYNNFHPYKSFERRLYLNYNVS